MPNDIQPPSDPPVHSIKLVSGQWEYFPDHSYYDMWCVRRKTERRWGQGFHVNNGQEAEELCRILNEYKVR